MNFKPVGKIAILLAISIVASLSCNQKRSNTTNENDTSSTTVAPGTNNTSFKQSGNDTSNKSTFSKFNYIKEKVENGTLYGVVEVGASGFNSFVINMDNKKRWEIVSKDFGKSFIYEGL